MFDMSPEYYSELIPLLLQPGNWNIACANGAGENRQSYEYLLQNALLLFERSRISSSHFLETSQLLREISEEFGTWSDGSETSYFRRWLTCAIFARCNIFGRLNKLWIHDHCVRCEFNFISWSHWQPYLITFERITSCLSLDGDALVLVISTTAPKNITSLLTLGKCTARVEPKAALSGSVRRLFRFGGA
jgi:hypothetical protein